MKNNLMIASPNEERILLWKQGLNGVVRSSLMTDQLHILWDNVERSKPELVLLDLDLLPLKNMSEVANLSILCRKTRVVIIGAAFNQEMEWELLKAGVRGFCQHEFNSSLLKKVLMAVQEGELWVSRSVTSRLLDEIGNITSKNKAFQATNDLLNKLTEREYDIALHVASGESNKKIAQSCAITERTVKAHLSEVFQKLGIADRVNLALIMSANDPQQAVRQNVM